MHDDRMILHALFPFFRQAVAAEVFLVAQAFEAGAAFTLNAQQDEDDQPIQCFRPDPQTGSLRVPILSGPAKRTVEPKRSRASLSLAATRE